MADAIEEHNETRRDSNTDEEPDVQDFMRRARARAYGQLISRLHVSDGCGGSSAALDRPWVGGNANNKTLCLTVTRFCDGGLPCRSWSN